MAHARSPLSVLQGLRLAARRWAWAAAGAVAAALLMFAWQLEVYEAHAQMQHSVQSLQGQALQAKPPAVPASADTDLATRSQASAWLARLPTVQDAAGLGWVLQKGLQQQGLQVLSLRPQPVQEGGPLASQALALRLQGRFADVAHAWAALVDAGPVWTLERLSATPSAPGGHLQWDGQWRVWLRPDAPHAQAWPALWPAGDRPRLGTAADPFVPVPAVGVSVSAPPASAAQDSASAPVPVSPDPRQWPLAQIRLWGVWQQGTRAQAVLGAGEHWAVLGTGARLALEDYRIQTIHPDALELQPMRRPGTVHVLRLQGATP